MRTDRRRVCLWIVGLCFAFAKAATAADLLHLALRHDAERRGDYDALAAEWLSALQESSSDFRVELLLRRLSQIDPLLAEPLAVLEPLEELVEGSELRGVSRQVAIDLLDNAYRRAGRYAETDRLQESRGFLRSFMVIGPFGKGASGALRRVFPPEQKLDFQANYRDGWQELRWRRARRSKLTPRIDPYDHVYPERGVVYLLSQVKSSEERSATVHVGARGPVKLWWNGSVLLDESERTTFLSNRRAVNCRLHAGWNHILVKTGSLLWIRLSTTEGDPFSPADLQEETADHLHEVETAGVAPAGPVFHAGALGKWETRLVDRPDIDTGASEGATETPEADLTRALEHLGLAFLYRFHGRPELAVEQVERATELAGEDPFVLHHAAETFESARYLPVALRKNRAREAWGRAIEIDPGFLPSRVKLARLLDDDGKTSEAATQLKQLTQEQPKFLLGLLELQRLFAQKNWIADERLALRSLSRIAPTLPLPFLRQAEIALERDHLSRAIELYGEAVERDGRRLDLLTRLAELERRGGDLSRAEALYREALEREPDDLETEADLVDLLVASGRSEEAVETLRKRMDGRPWDPAIRRALGALYERLNRDAEGVLEYRKSLDLAPGQVTLWRYVQRARGDTDRFWEPYDEALEDWIEAIPSEGPLVDKADALCVLDLSVAKVFADGSSTQYVHQAFKLLTEDSEESLAKVQTPGEVIWVRTLTPEGKVLEPVPAEGTQSFVMPGLEPGAYIDYAYRIDRPNAEGTPFREGPFFFQDYRFKHAFLLSRFALLVPSGLDAGILESGFTHQPPGADLVRVERDERELEDGSKVIVFEARNAPRLRAERSMPAVSEYVPNVTILPAESWEDVSSQLRDGREYRGRHTPELRRVAQREAGASDDPIETARAIYDFVNELVTADRGPDEAVGVLLEKAGDRTALFKALVDLAGVPASWAFLRPNDDLLPRANWQWPRASLFPAPYVVVEPPDREPVWVSLRYRRTPFGRLPEQFGGGRALVLTSRGHKIVALPRAPAEDYASRMLATMKLGEKLGVDVELDMVSQAQQGYALKERFRTMNSFQRGILLQAQASQLFPGARTRKVEFKNLEEPEKPLTLSFALTAPNLLKASGDGAFLLRALPQPLRMVRFYGGPPDRKHPYHLRQQRASRDRVQVVLGQNFSLHKLPADVVLTGDLLTYSLTYEVAKDGIRVERELTTHPGRLQPDEFPVFLKLCEDIDAAERESLVLRESRPVRADGE